MTARFPRAGFAHKTKHNPQRGTVGAAQLDQGWEGEAPADAAEAYYAHGADWGQAIDYTVIATLRCDVRPLPLVAASRSRRVVGEYVTAPILDVDMVGQRRRDLFIDYFAAIERHEITAPRVEPFYSEHRFCRVDDGFGSGHPPDTVVAMALAYHAFREARAPAITGSRSDAKAMRRPRRERGRGTRGHGRRHIEVLHLPSPRGPGCRYPPRQPSGRRHHATI